MSWQITIAACTLAQEARGEPLIGQQAVAWTFRNRIALGRWGKTLASVCLWNRHIPAGGQGFQYSGWRGQDPNFTYACNLDENDPVLVAMEAIVEQVMGADISSDPTGGASHYFAISIGDPAWTIGATYCGQFGNQKFYKGVK